VTAELARVGLRIPPAARLTLVVLGVIWALLAEAIRLRANWPITWVLGDLVPGLAFLVCGHIAWVRRPADRIGPLMIAVGFAWYAGTASASEIHLVDRTTHAFQGYYDALLAWLILAYPYGRLRWRPSQLVVGVFFVILAARTLFRFTVFPWSPDLDVSDAFAVERYIADVTLRDQGDALFRVLIAILAAAVLLLVVARLRVETAAGRAIAGPILLGGVGFATGILVETIGLMVPTGFAERRAAWDLGQWLTVGTASVIPIAFLFGLGQDRIARGRVADLVVGLGGPTPAPEDLQAALATALGDPSLTIAYPVPGTGRFVDTAGRVVGLPSDDASDRAVTRVARGGRTIAAILHDPALTERRELLTSVSAAAGLALENERLHAELQAQLAEVRASRARIVAAGDAERRRVERDLHDGAQQRLVTLALALQMARARVDDRDAEMTKMLDRAGAELERALAELRELARGIHPTVLTEDGLAAAVDVLAERAPVPVATSVPDRRFDPPIESAAYFVVAEGLTNVAKYARQASAWVEIRHDAGTLHVEVRDDGPGGADPYPGSGLQGLADRVAAVGGRLTVESPADRGTTIRAEIPCA
jgi:signal transduction histidine kinase